MEHDLGLSLQPSIVSGNATNSPFPCWQKRQSFPYAAFITYFSHCEMYLGFYAKLNLPLLKIFQNIKPYNHIQTSDINGRQSLFIFMRTESPHSVSYWQKFVAGYLRAMGWSACALREKTRFKWSELCSLLSGKLTEGWLDRTTRLLPEIGLAVSVLCLLHLINYWLT